MTNAKQVILALDVGERRIGLALGDSIGRIAMPLTTLRVDGTELVRLQRLMLEHEVTQLVVGLPRNQQGEETRQSQAVREFTKRHLLAFGLPITFQDESVTSVIAQQQLNTHKKPLSKEAIDAQAAALFLQDYLESVDHTLTN